MSEDIYTTPKPTDDTYENLRVSDPENTAQHGGFKKNSFKAVAVCVGLLLLAGIIVLAILNLDLTKQRDQWKTSFDEFQTRHDNLSEQRGQLLTRVNTMTDQRDQLQTSFDEFLSRHDTLTELKRIICESHGFTFGDGVCYYTSTEMKTWEDSRAFCTARLSYLMTIKSREKQDFVDRLGGSYQSVWLGLTDSHTEGVWKWVDGTPLTTPTYWSPGQPDGGEESNCVVFYNGGRGRGGSGWYDLPCGSTRYCICEIVF